MSKPIVTAADAMAELWGAFCPDCGPEHFGDIVEHIKGVCKLAKAPELSEPVRLAFLIFMEGERLSDADEGRKRRDIFVDACSRITRTLNADMAAEAPTHT